MGRVSHIVLATFLLHLIDHSSLIFRVFIINLGAIMYSASSGLPETFSTIIDQISVVELAEQTRCVKSVSDEYAIECNGGYDETDDYQSSDADDYVHRPIWSALDSFESLEYLSSGVISDLESWHHRLMTENWHPETTLRQFSTFTKIDVLKLNGFPPEHHLRNVLLVFLPPQHEEMLLAYLSRRPPMEYEYGLSLCSSYPAFEYSAVDNEGIRHELRIPIESISFDKKDDHFWTILVAGKSVALACFEIDSNFLCEFKMKLESHFDPQRSHSNYWPLLNFSESERTQVLEAARRYGEFPWRTRPFYHPLWDSEVSEAIFINYS